ncbi:zinc ribbon domain-containing protein [Pseudonocardia abyssalis]|uniref:zinc ribbon domain-containing protein n=1 Tax=Pseudonocardia abyssalis TaxID=2792008 RepID=UPI001C4A4099|nr:zinc ribbon domain-containing protein [Pseudonocardia abyssalis]
MDIGLPIGTAPETIPCPACGTSAGRVFTAPMLGLADRRRTAVLDHTEASRSAPPVVTSLPTSTARRAPAPRLDPRTARLPRP